MSVKTRLFDTLPDGRRVEAYTICDGSIEVEAITFGAAVRKILVPDQNGRVSDVVFGYDSVKPYINDGKYFGKTVGQCCNRIKGGRFTLNGKTYDLKKNENSITCLHGADEYSEALWQGEVKGDNCVEMTYFSKTMEKGFPGNVKASVTFTVEKNSFKIEYNAVSDEDTVINMTNHSYFNLGGFDSGDALGQIMSVCAKYYLPTAQDNCPTGEIRSVENTPFDFRIAKPIFDAVNSDDPQIAKCNGIDHNFCLRKKCANCGSPALVLADGKSGRKMSVYTNQPGVQIYTGNFLDGTCKNNFTLSKYAGIAIETQGYPDAPNNEDFPSVEVKAGEKYNAVTKFVFETV